MQQENSVHLSAASQAREAAAWLFSASPAAPGQTLRFPPLYGSAGSSQEIGSRNNLSLFASPSLFFSVVLFASLFGCVSLLLSFYVPFSSLFLLYLFFSRPCPSPFMTLSLSSPLPLALLHPLPLPHSLSTAVPKLSKTEKVRHNNRS